MATAMTANIMLVSHTVAAGATHEPFNALLINVTATLTNITWAVFAAPGIHREGAVAFVFGRVQDLCAHVPCL